MISDPYLFFRKPIFTPITRYRHCPIRRFKLKKSWTGSRSRMKKMTMRWAMRFANPPSTGTTSNPLITCEAGQTQYLTIKSDLKHPLPRAMINLNLRPSKKSDLGCPSWISRRSSQHRSIKYLRRRASRHHSSIFLQPRRSILMGYEATNMTSYHPHLRRPIWWLSRQWP